MAGAKLEFYRFMLNSKKEEFKTFREFAIEELGVSKNIKNENVTEAFLKYIIKSLDGEHSKDEKLKKQITLVKKSRVNVHLDKQPTFKSQEYIIHGVINGGPYGRERILSDVDDQENSEKIGRGKAVLLYFYFLLYLPPDHNEGCFIIHSNSADESITRIFRNFISHTFNGNNYNKAKCEPFCPQSFQDEFKKGAVLKKLVFKKSFVEKIHSTSGVSNDFNDYDIKIEAIPKNKNISIRSVESLYKFFSKKIFGNTASPRQLNDFDETNFLAENPVTHATKTFEWNSSDHEFVPVVYLEGRIRNTNDDGTPDFSELETLCHNYFNDEILPEIRPDLYVTRTP